MAVPAPDRVWKPPKRRKPVQRKVAPAPDRVWRPARRAPLAPTATPRRPARPVGVFRPFRPAREAPSARVEKARRQGAQRERRAAQQIARRAPTPAPHIPVIGQGRPQDYTRRQRAEILRLSAGVHTDVRRRVQDRVYGKGNMRRAAQLPYGQREAFLRGVEEQETARELRQLGPRARSVYGLAEKVGRHEYDRKAAVQLRRQGINVSPAEARRLVSRSLTAQRLEPSQVKRGGFNKALLIPGVGAGLALGRAISGPLAGAVERSGGSGLAGVLRTARAPEEIARAHIEAPGRTVRGDLGFVRDALLGLAGAGFSLYDDPDGTVKGIPDKLARVPKALRDDLSRRYGPLTEGNWGAFRERVKKEGAVAEILDLTIAGSGLGKGAGLAARGGALGRRAQDIVTVPRAQLRIAPGEARRQRDETRKIAPNLYRAAMQKRRDQRRQTGRGFGVGPVRVLPGFEARDRAARAKGQREQAKALGTPQGTRDLLRPQAYPGEGMGKARMSPRELGNRRQAIEQAIGRVGGSLRREEDGRVHSVTFTAERVGAVDPQTFRRVEQGLERLGFEKRRRGGTLVYYAPREVVRRSRVLQKAQARRVPAGLKGAAVNVIRDTQGEQTQRFAETLRGRLIRDVGSRRKLSKDQQAALTMVGQGRIPADNPQLARQRLAEIAKAVVAKRSEAGYRPGTFDRDILKLIPRLQENADAIFTPKLREAADEIGVQVRQAERANRDYLPVEQAVTARYGPAAADLDIERGEVPVRRFDTEASVKSYRRQERRHAERESRTTPDRIRPEVWEMGERRNVEGVPITALTPLQDIRARSSPKLRGAERERVRRSLRDEGWKEPIIVQWDQTTGRAWIGEGNNRLEVAKELGMTLAPVRVVRRSSDNPEGFGRKTSDPREGYIPADLAPSEIGLPGERPQARPYVAQPDPRAPGRWEVRIPGSPNVREGGLSEKTARDVAARLNRDQGRVERPPKRRPLIRDDEVPAFTRQSAVKGAIYHTGEPDKIRGAQSIGLDPARNKSGTYGKGIYASTTPDPKYGPLGARVALDIRKPLRMDNDEAAAVMKPYYDRAEGRVGTGDKDAYRRAVALEVQKDGYDGIQVRGAREDGGDYWVAFRPEQIRVLAPRATLTTAADPQTIRRIAGEERVKVSDIREEGHRTSVDLTGPRDSIRVVAERLVTETGGSGRLFTPVHGGKGIAYYLDGKLYAAAHEIDSDTYDALKARYGGRLTYDRGDLEDIGGDPDLGRVREARSARRREAAERADVDAAPLPARLQHPSLVAGEGRFGGSVEAAPGQRLGVAPATRSTPTADYIRTVRAELRRRGIEQDPFFVPSEEFYTPKFINHTAGGRRAPDAFKHRTYALQRLGIERTDPNVILDGIHRNHRMRIAATLVADTFDRVAHPRYQNLDGLALKRAIKREGFDPSQVAIWFPGLYRDAVTRRFRGQAGDLEAQSLGVGGDQRNLRAVLDPDSGDSAVIVAGSTKELLDALDGDRFVRERGTIVDRAAYDEMYASTKETLPGRLAERLKTLQSRAVLGALNLNWVQTDAVVNTAVAAIIGGVGPQAIRDLAWYRKLDGKTREWADAEVDVGMARSQVHVPHMGATLNNKFVNFYRAMRESPWGQKARPVQHSINAFLKLERGLANNPQRKALFVHLLRKEAYRQLDQDVGYVNGLLERLKGVVTGGPRERMLALAQNRQVVEELGRGVANVLGDWKTMTAFERHWLGRHLFFYPYLRYSLRMAFYTLPLDHPVRLALVAQVANLSMDEQRLLVGATPEDSYLVAGRYFFRDDDGTIREYNVRTFNPLGNVVTESEASHDLLQLLPPVVTIGLGQLMKRDIYRNRDWRVRGTADREALRDIGPLDGLLGAERWRIMAREAISLPAITREITKWMLPGEQGSDSLPFSPRPIQFKDPERIAQANRKLERDKRPLLEHFLQSQFRAFVSKESDVEDVLKRRRRARGKKGSTSSIDKAIDRALGGAKLNDKALDAAIDKALR